MALVFAAVVGFFPAFVLAAIDHLMAGQGLSRVTRAQVCAVLGYPAAALVYWMGLSSSFADEVFIAGLFGMIPAAVCSWLAGR